MRRFFSYTARGIGRLRAPDNSVGVQILLADGLGEGPVIRLDLAGPGNVTGLAPGTVKAVHPAPGSGDMRGGELPHVTLGDAGLAWSMTPQAPAGPILQPWLGLLCLPAGDDVQLDTSRQPLPVLTASAVGGRLPSPESYALTTFVDDPQAADLDDVPSPTAVARLLCPQLLEAETAWIAALVPLYRAGALAGLGEDWSDAGSAFAWSREDTTVRLPVYHFWRFSTGKGRSAADMLRDLTPFELGAAPSHHRVADRFADLAPALRGGMAAVRSVLAPPGPKDARPETALLPAFSRTTDDGEARLPIPSYGRIHAGGVTAEQADAPSWLHDVNHDLSLRVLAGHGAALVRERQEELAQFVMDQAGALDQANTVLDRANGAMRMAARLHAALPDPDAGEAQREAILGLAGPAAARLRVSGANGGVSLAASARGHTEAMAMDPAVRAMAGQGGRLDDGRPPPDTLSGAIAAAGQAVSLADEVAGASGLYDLWDIIDQPQPTRGATIDPDDVRDMFELLGRMSDPAQEGRDLPLGKDPSLFEKWENLRQKAGEERRRPGRQPVPHEMPEAAAIARDVRAALDPFVAVPPRLRDRIGGLPEGPLPSRLLAEPVWPEPILDAIFARDPAILAPGIDEMPADAIIGLTYDPLAMEALMVGANHELQAELRWRGIPTPFAVSPFRRAFPAPGEPGTGPARTDLMPLAQWTRNSRLGDHQDPRFDLGFVAVMRSDLMVRYPGTIVMLARATRADAWSAREIEPEHESDGRINHLAPSLQGRLGRDLLYVGFPKIDGGTLAGSDDPADPDQGWFLVFRQDPTGDTFGLGGSPGPTGAAPFNPAYSAWGELAWSDLARAEIAADSFSGSGQGLTWGADAAQMGQILLEKPVIVAIHLSKLITRGQGST